jgi:hypothetical protein
MLNGPSYLVTFNPSKSLTWDVKTWIAAPVVKPFTKVSDSNVHTIPIRNTYINSCEQLERMWLFVLELLFS